ncbi:MAG TPA: hypothetical protein PLL20_19420, partial [Phycisphaerae bacterium]|nr:hypothetical protein [Phycisphaerae bacterium]
KGQGMWDWWKLAAMLLGLAGILGGVMLGVCAVLAVVLGPAETEETESDIDGDRQRECQRMLEELSAHRRRTG